MRFNGFGMLLGLTAFLLAGWMGYEFYQPKGDKSYKSEDLTIVQTGPVSLPNQDTDNAQVLSKPNGENTRSALKLLSSSTKPEASSPTACFTFNAVFDQSNAVSLRDYFDVSPNQPLTLSVSNQSLCLSGFSYSDSYQVTWKAGLEALNGSELARDITKDVIFGDKPAFVGFAGEGVILPRVNAQGLAIQTVNVDALNVSIYRVTDRMLARRALSSGQNHLEGDYSWEGQNAATDLRREIWSGELDVKNTRNEKVLTVLPLQELVGELSSGAYVVRAERQHEAGEERVAKAWRWIMSTDLALTSYRAPKGLTVSVRSIDTAKLQPNIRLVLVAANNEVLGELITTHTGRAKFPAPLMKGQGALRPSVIMAYADNGDYNVLNLDRSPIDLSKYDINGRRLTGDVDIFAYTERGVYRPGETVYLTSLIRDGGGLALTDRSVSVKYLRPNGIEVAKQRFQSEALKKTSGAISDSYILPSSASRGQWSAVVEVDGAKRPHIVKFAVEDFVPQKLRLKLVADEAPISLNETRDLKIDAQFLYGAAGAGLQAEAEARLRIDPNPFPEFKDYAFGPSGSGFREKLIDIGGGTTDGSGVLELPIDIDWSSLETSYPLRAEITAGVAEPGGRYTRDSLRIPVRTQDSYIGIKSDTTVPRFKRGKPTAISIIGVNKLGGRIQAKASFSLIEEDWDYQWYRQNGRWRYRRDVIDTIIDTGDIELTTDKPARFAQRLDWGSYRLEVKIADGASSSYRFSVGWGSGEKSDTPDLIQMSGPTQPIKAGDTLTLDVNAPYSGEAELVIAGQSIHIIKTVELEAGGSQISMPFDPDWGDSVYAMLSLYTRRDSSLRPIPRRAVGISYIALDRQDQTLKVDIEAPQLIRPRSAHTVSVSIDNIPRGQTVHMTLAAVDEGILQLTKYKSPDAAKTLFGKKRLNLDVFDDYARLLNPNLGTSSIANSGGDSLGGEGLTAVPTRTVALYEGIVIAESGKAEVTFDIPDFNGELRLMATAWTDTAVGSASKAITVRDKVPAIIGLPRFLAPGDKAIATLSLDNVEGESGEYNVFAIGNGATTTQAGFTLDLNQGQREEGTLTLQAKVLGVDDITVNVEGPADYTQVSQYTLQVRSPFRDETRVNRFSLAPNETFELTKDKLISYTNYVEGSVDIDLSFSMSAGLNATPYVRSLSRYPHGCTEQIVATAMPLLYADALGGVNQSGLRTDKLVSKNIQKAINRLINRQDVSGVFGLWREGDGNARAWLGAHTVFFLQEAEKQGYAVPKDVMSRAYTSLQELARMPRYPNLSYRFDTDRYNANGRNLDREKSETAAYAHYVLARAGKGKLPAMRYHFDQKSEVMKTPLSYAHIGAALKMMGDDRRGDLSFAKGFAQEGYETASDYYQSKLRDNAGFLSLAKEVQDNDSVEAMLPKFVAQLDDPDRLNTQEKAFVILAMQAILKDLKPANIRARNGQLNEDGKVKTSSHYDTDLVNVPSFTNLAKAPVYVTLVQSGAPKSAPEAFENGFQVEKRYFALDGKTVDFDALKQGQRAIVALQFASESRRSRMAVISDLLPAGLEIETVLRPEDGVVTRYGERKEGAYAFLGKLDAFDVIEARDDRFVASLETYRDTNYRAAYIVRAVSPGDFINPGVIVEDMYRPQDRAVTNARRLKVTTSGAF